jgi:hypothetical protein
LGEGAVKAETAVAVAQASVAAPNDQALLIVCPDKNLLRAFRGAFDR